MCFYFISILGLLYLEERRISLDWMEKFASIHQIQSLASSGWSIESLKIMLQPRIIQFYLHVPLMYCCYFVTENTNLSQIPIF